MEAQVSKIFLSINISQQRSCLWVVHNPGFLSRVLTRTFPLNCWHKCHQIIASKPDSDKMYSCVTLMSPRPKRNNEVTEASVNDPWQRRQVSCYHHWPLLVGVHSTKQDAGNDEHSIPEQASCCGALSLSWLHRISSTSSSQVLRSLPKTCQSFRGPTTGQRRGDFVTMTRRLRLQRKDIVGADI